MSYAWGKKLLSFHKKLSEFDSVVLFSTADWDNPFWTNKQHMACKLAEAGFKVFYIESLGLRRVTVAKSDLGRIGRRLLRFFKGARQVQPNIWVYSPLVLPLHGYHIVEILNNFLLKTIVNFYRFRLKFVKTIGWTYNPLVYDLLKSLDFDTVVYHSVDDLSAAPRLPGAEIERNEKLILRYAANVFVTSVTLKNKYLGWGREDVYYSPNVADYEHFSKALLEDLASPKDMKAFRGPKVGFIGAISGYKVDFDMLAQAADQTPQWNWIMIGKVGEGDPGTDITKLQKSNIHLLGARSYQELPAYLKEFDVVIIPSPLNDYTRAMFPMKFFEYLAAGKVIVATDLPSLQEFDDVFLKATDSDALIAHINSVLSGQVLFSSRMKEVAQEHTWDKRMGKMFSEIEKSLQKKPLE